MKRAVVFFLCLCFYLSAGYPFAYAGTPHSKDSYSLTRAIEKRHAKENTAAQQHNGPAQTAAFREEHDTVSSFDNEDEDFARKRIALARYVVAFSYAFILICLCNGLKEQLPFSRPLSQAVVKKHIVQRTLRI